MGHSASHDDRTMPWILRVSKRPTILKVALLFSTLLMWTSICNIVKLTPHRDVLFQSSSSSNTTEEEEDGLDHSASLVNSSRSTVQLLSTRKDPLVGSIDSNKTNDSSTSTHHADAPGPARGRPVSIGSSPGSSLSSSSSVSSSLPVPTIAPPLTTNTTIQGIPKIVWLYWDRGLDHLADIGGPHSTPNKYQADYACVQAWQILHPTWDVRILNRTTAMTLAPNFARLASIPRTIDGNNNHRTNGTRICPVKLGNLLRTELMALYGGVYADTSICPMRPLDDYVDHLIPSSHVDFFVPPFFSKAGALSRRQLQKYKTCHIRDRSSPPKKPYLQLAGQARMLDSYFMVARPQSLVMQRWMQAYTNHLEHMVQTTPDQSQDVCTEMPYFIFQCMFTLQVLRDAQFEEAWFQFKRQLRPHNGYWKTGKTAGMCYGAAPKDPSMMNVHHVRTQCFWLKKQIGPLTDYVRSPAYHTDMAAVLLLAQNKKNNTLGSNDSS